MKSKIVVWGLLMASVLAITACGGQESAEPAQSIEVHESKSIESSINVEKPGSVETKEAPEATQIPEVTNPPEVAAPTTAPQSIFAISEQWQGTYAEFRGYNQEYVVIDETAVTYYHRDVPYVYGAENFTAVVEADGTKVSIMKGDVIYLMLQFSQPEEMPEAELEIYRLGEEVLAEAIHFKQNKTTILNYLPTEDYVDLDALGPWGRIPYSQEIADILLKNQDEDYRIEYKEDVPMPIFSSDMMSLLAIYNCDCYMIFSYNEDGYMKNNPAAYIVFDEPEAAKAYCDYWCTLGSADFVDYVVDGNVFYYQTKLSSANPLYNDRSIKLSSFGYYASAADTHCVYAGNSEYIYHSHPASTEQCEEAVEVERLIQEMFCNRTEAVEGDAWLKIQGNGFASGCIIETTYYEAFTVNAYDMAVKGDTLLFLGRENIEPYVTLAEVTKEGTQLKLHARIYSVNENVNFDNYLEKNIYKDLTYTFNISGKR